MSLSFIFLHPSEDKKKEKKKDDVSTVVVPRLVRYPLVRVPV